MCEKLKIMSGNRIARDKIQMKFRKRGLTLGGQGISSISIKIQNLPWWTQGYWKIDLNQNVA
jgi:hypothetical protein